MNNTIKQEVRERAQARFEETADVYSEANLVALMRAFDVYEREIDHVREATIQECVDALPKWKQLYMAPDGWNEYKDEARTTLLALKNKNIDV